MPTISAFDPGLRYDDADKEAEAQRQAANDFMFRSRLQQQAAAQQQGLQGNMAAAQERMNSADLADRAQGRASDLANALTLGGSYKQHQNDQNQNAAAQLAGQKDLLGLQGQNQIAAINAGQAPAMGALALDQQRYSDGAPERALANTLANAKGKLYGDVLGDGSSGSAPAPTTPNFPLSGPQSAADPMGLYGGARTGGGPNTGMMSPQDAMDRRALKFGLLGIQAPTDPKAEINNQIRQALAGQLTSSDPTVRQNAASELAKQGFNVPSAGLGSGGLNTGNIDELNKVQSLVGPDIQDLKSYTSSIGGWIGSGNEAKVLNAVASIKQKLDTAGANPTVKQQVLGDLYTNLTSSLDRSVYNLPGTGSLLAKLKTLTGSAAVLPEQMSLDDVYNSPITKGLSGDFAGAAAGLLGAAFRK